MLTITIAHKDYDQCHRAVEELIDHELLHNPNLNGEEVKIEAGDFTAIEAGGYFSRVNLINMVMDVIHKERQMSKGTRQTVEPVVMHFIGDGNCKGTNFYWQDRINQWVVVDLETQSVSTHDELVLVRCSGDTDKGLNQMCLGCDLEGQGLWLIDADDLESYEDGYLYDVTKITKGANNA